MAELVDGVRVLWWGLLAWIAVGSAAVTLAVMAAGWAVAWAARAAWRWLSARLSAVRGSRAARAATCATDGAQSRTGAREFEEAA